MQRRNFLQALVAAVTAAPAAAEVAASAVGGSTLVGAAALSGHYVPGKGCSAVAGEIFDPGEAMRDMAMEAMQRGELPAFQSASLLSRTSMWNHEASITCLKSVSPVIKQKIIEEVAIAKLMRDMVEEHRENQVIKQAEKWVASKNPFAEFHATQAQRTTNPL